MIDIDFSKKQKEYLGKCKDALKDNSKLIDELRELGICYNPNIFKNDYGFIKDSKNKATQITLEKSDSEYNKKDDILSKEIDKNEKVVLFEDDI